MFVPVLVFPFLSLSLYVVVVFLLFCYYCLSLFIFRFFRYLYIFMFNVYLSSCQESGISSKSDQSSSSLSCPVLCRQETCGSSSFSPKCVGYDMSESSESVRSTKRGCSGGISGSSSPVLLSTHPPGFNERFQSFSATHVESSAAASGLECEKGGVVSSSCDDEEVGGSSYETDSEENGVSELGEELECETSAALSFCQSSAGRYVSTYHYDLPRAVLHCSVTAGSWCAGLCTFVNQCRGTSLCVCRLLQFLNDYCVPSDFYLCVDELCSSSPNFICSRSVICPTLFDSVYFCSFHCGFHSSEQ